MLMIQTKTDKMDINTHHLHSDLRTAQLRMLDMLTYIDEICRKNNIKYWIDYGTLLGAVRHNGFIPWDDDIDITMPREDFIKFRMIFNGIRQSNYILQDNILDENYFNHWAVIRDLNSEYIQANKIHNIRHYRGLQVDIFMVDDNIVPFLKHITDLLTKFNYLQLLKSSSLANRCVAKIIYKFQYYVLHPLFYKFSKRKPHGPLYRYSYGIPFREYYSRTLVHPLIELQFEGKRFYAPSCYKEYLRILYGDYMKLPPVEQRRGHDAQYVIW